MRSRLARWIRSREQRDGWRSWRSWTCLKKLEKLENVEQWKHRDGLTKTTKDKMYRTIVDGFVKQCNGTGVTLNAVGEAELNARCVDVVTGKGLPWSAVRRAREEELKYLRDLSLYEEVDGQTALVK